MNKIYCMHCGSANNYGDHFCIKCGAPLVYESDIGKNNDTQGENIFQSATRTINSWTGEDKSVQINLGNFFSQVWRKHTQDEAEEIFIAGTKSTTPSLNKVSSKPVQPWLYSRIFVGLMLTVGLLYVLMDISSEQLVYTFLNVLCITVPVTLLIFFFEINVFKNISFYLTMKICVIGGIMSLIVTLCIYAIVGTNYNFDIFGALLIGIVEETGKLLVGCYFVSKLRLTHVFNGMLVGGAIGAGFAAIENIEYATSLESALLVPVIRSI